MIPKYDWIVDEADWVQPWSAKRDNGKNYLVEDMTTEALIELLCEKMSLEPMTKRPAFVNRVCSGLAQGIRNVSDEEWHEEMKKPASERAWNIDQDRAIQAKRAGFPKELDNEEHY